MPSKIIIYSEEDEIRESLKLILASQYGLILTGDSGQGLDCLTHAKDVGLVLWDINASDEDGLKTLKTIIANFPKLPIVALVPGQSTKAGNKVLGLGAAGCITKPFKADEILALINNKIK